MKFITLFFFSALSLACTSFEIPSNEGPIVGKSYDWEMGHGYALINLRNLKKTALNIFAGETPATWTSKFGSLTYNQHGIEFPLSGINEKGLIVEILWLDESVYAKKDARPSINELQWVQYQLDNFASTAEVLLSIEKVRLRNVSAKVHYMICDSLGECATVDFVKGQSVVHTGANLPYKAITNDTYDHSLAYLKTHMGFGGPTEISSESVHSLDRFCRAVAFSQKESTLNGVFSILDSVKDLKSDCPTVWNLAYEPLSGRAHFRTTVSPEIRSIDLKAFNFSCKEDSMMLNMEDKLSGDVTARFIKYDRTKNAEMIHKSFPGFLAKFLGMKMEKYPSSVKCLE